MMWKTTTETLLACENEYLCQEGLLLTPASKLKGIAFYQCVKRKILTKILVAL